MKKVLIILLIIFISGCILTPEKHYVMKRVQGEFTIEDWDTEEHRFTIDLPLNYKYIEALRLLSTVTYDWYRMGFTIPEEDRYTCYVYMTDRSIGTKYEIIYWILK